MNINPSPVAAQASLTVTPATRFGPTPAIGERLTATVLRVTDQGVATLAVRDVSFNARTALPLKPGQVLNLVVANNRPDVVMKVVPRQAEAALPQALRYAVSHQQPHAEILANLKYLANRPLTTVAHLPSTVMRLVRELVHNLADTRQLASAEGMKSAVANAGLFLERKLWQQAAGHKQHGTLAGDFKAALLHLRAALSAASHAGPPPPVMPPPSDPRRARVVHAQPRSAPTLALDRGKEATTGELLRQVEGALARVQLQQLSTLLEQQRGNAVWYIELPVAEERDVGIVHLKVERDTSGKGKHAGSSSAVTFAVNLPGLGALCARVMLVDKRVSVVLWGEREATVALVAEHIDELRTRLEAVGLRATTLACYRGHPPADDAEDDEVSLLDFRV